MVAVYLTFGLVAKVWEWKTVEFKLILRQSESMVASSFENILKNAKSGIGKNPYGHHTELLRLLQKPHLLWSKINGSFNKDLTPKP